MMNMIQICTVASQWCKDDSVLKRDVADSKWLEKSGRVAAGSLSVDQVRLDHGCILDWTVVPYAKGRWI